jgi:hypothetical protein
LVGKKARKRKVQKEREKIKLTQLFPKLLVRPTDLY